MKTYSPPVTMNEGTAFSLEIPAMVMNKIMYWMQKAAPKECSGFGSIEYNAETQCFKIFDAVVLDDGKSGSYTEIDGDQLGKVMSKLKHNNSVRWWWHSHVNMGAFWSGTDKDTIIELGQKGWQVATVFNLRRELRTAFLTTVDVMGNKHDLFVDEIPTTIEHEIPKELMDQWTAEFQDVVEKNKAKAPAWSKSLHYHYSNNDNEYGEYIPKYSKIKQEDMRSAFKWEGDDPLISPNEIEWGPDGYANVEGHYLYNPLRDQSIQTIQDIIWEINKMSIGEVNSLIINDDRFEEFYEKHMEDKV